MNATLLCWCMPLCCASQPVLWGRCCVRCWGAARVNKNVMCDFCHFSASLTAFLCLLVLFYHLNGESRLELIKMRCRLNALEFGWGIWKSGSSLPMVWCVCLSLLGCCSPWSAYSAVKANLISLKKKSVSGGLSWLFSVAILLQEEQKKENPKSFLFCS